MISVLFVCLGNICRSPMAEAIFRDKVNKAGLTDEISVDSAGTAGYHIGHPPHEGTQHKLDEFAIPYDTIKARQFAKKDFKAFDYIVAMDEKNIESLKEIDPKDAGKVVYRMMDFTDKSYTENVPDPYYTGDFNETYALLSEATDGLLSFIREKHHI